MRRQACSLFVCSVSLLLAAPVGAVAQEARIPERAATSVDSLAARALPAPRHESTRNLPAEGPFLDVPIVRSEYALGPGDVVDVSIHGEFAQLHTLAIGPEGTLVLPGMGVVNLLGLDLDAAEERVRRQVLRYHRNVETSLNLSRIRTFNVFVVGAVDQPGVRQASSATRVAELVPLGEARDTVLRRNVVVRRADGSEVRADLARFRLTGDLRSNPTVREGDVVLVPSIDRVIHVHGQVAFPGTYEYRDGESLAEFLEVVNGTAGFPPDAADTLRLTRFAPDRTREFRAMPRVEASGGAGRALALQPFDAVFVPGRANYRQQRFATVEGQVRYPGRYPVRADTTSLRELVQMAGGFTGEASLANATLRRAVDTLATAAYRSIGDVPAAALSRHERQILQIQSQSEPGNVVVDLAAVFAEGVDALDQRVRDGDVLTVPRRRDEVVVLGAVPQPGIVPYAPNRRAEYFVELAGGYARRAQRSQAVVVNAQTGARTDLRDTPRIEPGDMIVVPYREHLSWQERLQTLSFVATTVSSIVLSYILISGRGT